MARRSDAPAPLAGRPAPPSARLRFVALALVAGMTLVLAEAGARVTQALRRATPRPPVDASTLDVYEQPDPRDPTLWRPRAGARLTLGEAIAAKRAGGQALGVAALEAARELGVGDDEVVLAINGDGTKGPEIDRSHRRPRILTLGDSCTFGTLVDRYSYPRVAEAELARLGSPAEVVNGGVEAYGVAEVRLRLEEFRRLQPDITTIYVGWNDLYREDRAAPPALCLPDLVRSAWRRIAMTPREAAQAELFRPKRPDPGAGAIARLERWTPSSLGDLATVITELEAGGSQVVLLTLPGLYVSGEEPSPKALAIGHLPAFTDNPLLLAAMTERYNREVRALAAQRGLRVIDLEAWSRTALVPRDRYFIDSVHLTLTGQEMLGKKIAADLADVVAAVAHDSSR